MQTYESDPDLANRAYERSKRYLKAALQPDKLRQPIRTMTGYHSSLNLLNYAYFSLLPFRTRSLKFQILSRLIQEAYSIYFDVHRSFHRYRNVKVKYRHQLRLKSLSPSDRKTIMDRKELRRRQLMEPCLEYQDL